MSCNTDKCEHIKRTSLLLRKYQQYQTILHPQQICKYKSTPQTQQSSPTAASQQNGFYHDIDSFDATDDNEAGVAFVETIDEYNNDLIQYDVQEIESNARDSQNEDSAENDNEQDDNEDILVYFDNLDGQITNILDDYNHIIIHHYNDDFEEIYNLIQRQCAFCDINECPSFLRNNRCRETTNLLTFMNESRKDIDEDE